MITALSELVLRVIPMITLENVLMVSDWMVLTLFVIAVLSQVYAVLRSITIGDLKETKRYGIQGFAMLIIGVTLYSILL